MPLRLQILSKQAGELGEGAVREFVGCGGTIGRAAESDWILPDEKRFISSRHALIDFQGGAYYLVDTSRNGVYVNGADTAVGRGHPQRLFDGDRLRLGEYEIAVQIAGEDQPDDGMRDSLVRDQLVPVDESMELKLVDESKLRAFDYNALEKHVRPAESDKPRPARQAAPAAPAPAGKRPAPASTAATSALELFCQAAGLKQSDLRGSNPEETLETAGRLMRELLTGLADLLQNRSRMKDALRLPHTIIRPAQNNPLKFSANVADALRYLLGEAGDSYLPPERAVQAAFHDVRNHQQALFKAMIHAVRDFAERLDPDELRDRFDRGLKRSPLLAGANKLKYWELYEESYQTIAHQDEGAPMPRLVIDELTRAYEEELAALQAGVGRNPPQHSAQAP